MARLPAIWAVKGGIALLLATRGRAPMKPLELPVGNHRLRFDCKVEGKRVMSKPRYVNVAEGKETLIEYLCADGE